MINLNETIKGKPRWMRIAIILLGLTLPMLMLVAGIIVAIWILQLCTCGLSRTYEMNAPYFRSLPSDEVMIAHFRKHQADFEHLVRIYREDPVLLSPGPKREWKPQIKAIIERLGVKSMFADQKVWMPPDPYSKDAEQRVRTRGLVEKALWFNPAVRKYSGVLLRYDHPPVRRLNGYLSEVYKGYYYTPFPPKIEKGRLKTPQGDKQLFSTLDSYPSGLTSGDCVYRRFEPKWFIEMCQEVP